MSDELYRETIEELREAIENEDVEALDHVLEAVPVVESAIAVTRLNQDDQGRLLELLDNEDAAELIEALPDVQAAQMVGHLESAQAAAILNEMASDEQADVLGRLPDETAEAVLAEMAPEEAEDARLLLQYAEESAGGLMVTEFLAFAMDLDVDDVLRDLRTNAELYREYDVQYAYVVDSAGKLVGVLRLRDLLLAQTQLPIQSFMITDPLHVHVDDPLEELQRFFEHHSWFGVPVVDDAGTLVGVVRQQDVQEAAADQTSRSLLKFTGILGGEELRTMPLRLRSARRLSWLSINIVLNIIAASVIAAHQDTLAAVISLAVFLPIISDMSGCSGNQAVAVSMRELALGMVRPSECWRVLYKEATVGLVNGLVLGAMLGVIAFLWQGLPALGLVVAVAMAVNTIVAACLGGAVPLILRGLGQDPALASGPILTTVTDMCGFLLVLSLASALLPYLT